jgi:hypothetical protein
MDPSEAVQFTQELLFEYGLKDWRVELDRALRHFGCCHYAQRAISLSHQLIRLNNQTEVLDFILHEIAHAIVGPDVGHGPACRHAARVIGCRGERCYSTARVVQPPPRVLLRCTSCGNTARRLKMPRRQLACSLCCMRFAHGAFDPRCVLTVERNTTE